MRDFDLCGLEMHSSSMWSHAHVRRALDFMAVNGFNALIFHRSDVLNHLVLPAKYLSQRMMWEDFCALRSFEIENNRHFLGKVIRDARRRSIDFYFNLKEIFYTDEIPELFPGLMVEKGLVCPTDPFWWEYIEACVEELCENVPGFAGLILSAGTHESRSSITKRRPCRCARCASTPPLEWYTKCFEAVQRPLERHAKRFIVRDFSFSAANQSVILKAATSVSKDVIISLKNTPHDYFPTFPDNPKIGTTGQAEWVEFDSWGQFYGAGIFPASLAEDLRDRLQSCRAKKVKGVFFRTDWEGMYENSTFSSPNMINLYAAGLLSSNVEADLDLAYRKWAAAGWIATLSSDSDLPDPSPPAASGAWKNMRDFMKASWEVLRKTVYVRGHWFCEDNMFPESLDTAFKMMVYVHGRDQWEPGASRLVEPTEENLRVIFEEKEQALAECRGLPGILKAENLGFSEETLADIHELFMLYEAYCEIGRHSCRTVFLTQRALDTGRPDHRAEAAAAVAELLKCRESVVGLLAAGDGKYPHIIYWLLNERRMRELAADAAGLLDGSRRQIVKTDIRG